MDKESTCNAGDLGSIPELGRSPGEGIGYPLQCSGLENSMDYTVHGVTNRWTRLSNFHFHLCDKEKIPSRILEIELYNSKKCLMYTIFKMDNQQGPTV